MLGLSKWFIGCTQLILSLPIKERRRYHWDVGTGQEFHDIKVSGKMFPDDTSMAEARLKNLKKRFSTDKQYHWDYTRFMKDTVQKGHPEKSFQQIQQGKTRFIPHQAIYHPRKPGKTHVIFDWSAEYNGVSINKKLVSFWPHQPNKECLHKI